MKLFIILLILLTQNVNATDIDQEITRLANLFKITSPKLIVNNNKEEFEFGKKLFSDPILSLNNDISCKVCHHPTLGTSDALPFSIGTGSAGIGSYRVQRNAKITNRNSPNLYNKGHPSISSQFWDGRVSYNRLNNTYSTPEAGLNGKNPEYINIKSKIKNVLAMQAIFPIASVEEMRGQKFKQLSNKEVWDQVAAKVKKDPRYKIYTKNRSDFNIADIANALSHFQTIEFQVNDTPFDQYLNGDKSALTQKEKKGALLFMDVQKAGCVRCHNGPLLSNQMFQSIGVTQIGNDLIDLGRGIIDTNNWWAKYTFKTSPLRNVALSAPYMHNGSLIDLKSVVDHYQDSVNAQDIFEIAPLLQKYAKNYNQKISVDDNINRVEERKLSVSPPARFKLFLNDTEKEELLCFLKKSLTQKKFHSRLNLKVCL